MVHTSGGGSQAQAGVPGAPAIPQWWTHQLCHFLTLAALPGCLSISCLACEV